jgi:flagellar FliL protein
MADEKTEQKEAQPEEVKKKSFPKLIIFAVIGIVLAGGGFFGWNMFMAGDPEEVQEAQTSRKIEESNVAILCPLESFIVNLLDKAGLGKRYLKVTMELEVNSEQDKGLVEKSTAKLRDTILLLLSGLSFSDINTIEGKVELKKWLLTRINQILGEGTVEKIYFSEFVVQ